MAKRIFTYTYCEHCNWSSIYERENCSNCGSPDIYTEEVEEDY